MHVCMWVGAYVDKRHVDRDRDRGECGDRDRSRGRVGEIEMEIEI